MKKTLLILVAIFSFMGGISQTQQPSSLPTVNAPTAWYQIRGVRDSMKMFIPRDTFPAKFATLIFHPNLNFYYTLGNNTKWMPFLSSGGSVDLSAYKTWQGTKDTLLPLIDQKVYKSVFDGDYYNEIVATYPDEGVRIKNRTPDNATVGDYLFSKDGMQISLNDGGGIGIRGLQDYSANIQGNPLAYPQLIEVVRRDSILNARIDSVGGVVPNLQSVTDAGNATTNSLDIGYGLNITDDATGNRDLSINSFNAGQLYVTNNLTGIGYQLSATSLTSSRNWTLPNSDGTLPLKVNGVGADVNGNIVDTGYKTELAVTNGNVAANTVAIGGKLNIADTANIRFRPQAGTNVTLTGTYPNITIAASGGTTLDTTTIYRNFAGKKDTTGILGTLYNKNSWTSGTLASDFIINGAAPTISGTKFTLTGGALTPGPPTSSLDINGYHCLENWHLDLRYAQQAAKSATTFGAAIGLRSTAANFPSSIIAYVDLSTGVNAGKLTIISTVGGTSKVSTSSTALTYTPGDKQEISFDKKDNKFFAWARNATTNSLPIFTELIYTTESSSFNASFNLPNTGRFAVWTINGTGNSVLIDSVYAGSSEMVRPDIALLMDSKAKYNANYNTNLAHLLRSEGFTVVDMSGGGNRTVDAFNVFDDIRKIKPRAILSELGTNDGTDSSSVKINYQKLVDSAHANGISFIHLRPFRQQTEAWAGRTDWIDRTYSVDSIIDTRTPTFYNGALDADSVHLTNYGISLAAQTIIASGKVKGGGAKIEIGPSVFYPDLTQDPITLPWGGLTTINSANGIPYFKLSLSGGGSSTNSFYGDGFNVNRGLRFDATNDFVTLATSNGQGLVITPTALVNQKTSFTTPNVTFTTGGGILNGTASGITITPITGATAIPNFYSTNGSYGTSSATSPSSLFTYFSTIKGTIPAPSMTTTNRNAIPIGLISTGSATAGTGYVNGTYPGVPLIGGSGTGAIATVVIAGGVFNGLTITTLGANYLVGDVLTFSSANVGGTGSGASWTVTALSTEGLHVYDNTVRMPYFNNGTSWQKYSNFTSSGNDIYNNNTGNVGIGTTTPSAALHLKAGVATASSAPFKYTSGVSAQTSLENGAKNYDGSNEYLTTGGVNYTIAKTLTNTATLDFTSTAAQSGSELTITVTGAADGDAVSLGVPNASTLTNSSYSAWVSASNTITIRYNNYSTASQDPLSGTFRVSIIKY